MFANAGAAPAGRGIEKDRRQLGTRRVLQKGMGDIDN